MGWWRRGVLALGVLALILGLALLLWPQRAVEVQGHRGARGLLPENTLAAYERARGLGVDTIEMDTAVTKDGVLVTVHDATLDPDVARDATGAWVAPDIAVNSLTFGELQGYDVGRLRPGTDYAAMFPAQQPIDGAHVPALREVLTTLGPSGTAFNIETKISPDAPELSPDPEAYATLLVEEIRKDGVAEQSTIQSFDWRTLAVVQRIAPEITTSALTEADLSLLEDGRWTNGLRLADFGGSVPRLVAASGADIWSPNATTLTPDLVSEAHTQGLRVIPWTVNDLEGLERAVAMGVDGVISDYPDRALDVVRGAPRWPAITLLVVGGIMVLTALLVPQAPGRVAET